MIVKTIMYNHFESSAVAQNFQNLFFAKLSNCIEVPFYALITVFCPPKLSN